MSTPLDGAATPAAAREFRIFSTEVAVRAVQPSHASLKQLSTTLVGDQLSNRLAGKVVREVQLCHAPLKLVPAVMLTAGKVLRELQLLHVSLKIVPLERLKAGNEVNLLQPFHVCWKLRVILPEVLNVMAGKEVKLALLQLLHANWKERPAVRSKAGKDVRPVQLYHA